MAKTITRVLGYVFMGLVLLAPFSLFPSVGIPIQNFDSFRVGLYQVLAVAFIGISAWPFIKHYISTPFDRYARYIYTASVLLVGIAMYNLTSAIEPGRSLLMSASFTFLIILMLVARWYVSATEIVSIVPKILVAAIVYGAISIAQLAIATFDSDTQLICSRCGEEVFGFPRINGFAAEPLFWASALMPFWLLSMVTLVKRGNWLSKVATSLTTIAIVLTFSRGAYVALVAMALISVLVGLVHVRNIAKPVGLVLVSVGLGLLLLIGSASIRYSETPNIHIVTAKGMIEHLSGGLVEFETTPTEQASPVKTEDNFQSSGFVEASTQDRLGAAELALKAWNQPGNSLLGVGLGNLGPYVVQNIDPSSPSNLTVYIFYVLLLSEMGILGVLLWLGLIIITIVRLIKQGDDMSKILIVLLAGFMTHYAFFGSYINVIYVWLWIGIAMGYVTKTAKKGKIRS